jgi:hypothetical protein
LPARATKRRALSQQTLLSLLWAMSTQTLRSLTRDDRVLVRSVLRHGVDRPPRETTTRRRRRWPRRRRARSRQASASRG